MQAKFVRAERPSITISSPCLPMRPLRTGNARTSFAPTTAASVTCAPLEAVVIHAAGFRSLM